MLCFWPHPVCQYCQSQSRMSRTVSDHFTCRVCFPVFRSELENEARCRRDFLKTNPEHQNNTGDLDQCDSIHFFRRIHLVTPRRRSSRLASLTAVQGRQLCQADALNYLDAIKEESQDQPDIYNHFLDIMKDFKKQLCVKLFCLPLIFGLNIICNITGLTLSASADVWPTS